jgi:hypothetical protein
MYAHLERYAADARDDGTVPEGGATDGTVAERVANGERFDG